MSSAETREALRRARDELDGWTFEARDRAYSELFEGESAVVSDAELALLDSVDSALTRQTGTGLWGSDEYGVVAPDSLAEDSPQVVCTYHPEIPYETIRGEESLDEATREQLNDVLWDYAERVAGYIQTELDVFLRDLQETDEFPEDSDSG